MLVASGTKASTSASIVRAILVVGFMAGAIYFVRDQMLHTLTATAEGNYWAGYEQGNEDALQTCPRPYMKLQ